MKELDFKPYIRLAIYHTWIRDYFLDRSIYDFEIIYIDGGQLALTIDNKTLIAKEGDVVIIPPNTPHIISWAGCDCNQPHVHFDFQKDELSELIPVSKKPKSEMNSEELKFFRNNYLKDNGIDIPYVYTTKYRERVRSLILDIINKHTFKFKNPMANLAMEGALKSLLSIIIMENMGYSEDEEKTDTLSLAVRFMSENIHSNMTLEDLESQLKITSWTINKMFKEAYGVSPKKYYDSLRLRYAKNLLRHSFKSVKEISYLMGYKDAQTFSRWFKHLSGYYPTQYKQRVTKEKETKNEIS